MRTLKKIAAGLLAAALAVGLLTACSDNKVTGTAKSWSLSNTGKVLGKGGGLSPQTLLTYEVNGTLNIKTVHTASGIHNLAIHGRAFPHLLCVWSTM